MEAKLRSGVSGLLKSIDTSAMKAIRALPSYQSEMLGVAVGKRIELTIDAVTACGNVNLVNEDLAQLQADMFALEAEIEAETEMSALQEELARLKTDIANEL